MLYHPTPAKLISKCYNLKVKAHFQGCHLASTDVWSTILEKFCLYLYSLLLRQCSPKKHLQVYTLIGIIVLISVHNWPLCYCFKYKVHSMCWIYAYIVDIWWRIKYSVCVNGNVLIFKSLCCNQVQKSTIKL